MNKRFIPLIFTEGAAVMAVELCGAKMLTPLYGSSLFVWAAVLAITLGALAGGYFFGGVLSSKTRSEGKLSAVISSACLYIAVMPFISFYILPYISYLPFNTAVIISAFLLIFIPNFLLGCASPLFVKLNSSNLEKVGMVSGQVYALSTIGGIVSTLLCGFVLIPLIGFKFTLLAFAMILFVISWLTLKVFKTSQAILLFLIIVYSSGKSINNDSNIYSRHGILGEIEVVDVNYMNEKIRKLLINKIVQTEMVLESKTSPSAYIKMIDSLIAPRSEKGDALILGLGGGLVANLLKSKNYNVTGVEFDERIIFAARNYFGLDASVKAVCDDARHYMNTSDSNYDVIMFDLFKAEEQPSHVITRESLVKVKKMLKKSGIILINWHGYLKLPVGLGTSVLLNTMHNAGFSTEIITNSEDENYRNLLILAKADPTQGISPVMPENTDDLQMLEYANARANLLWRKNYLNFYQNK